MPSDFAGFQCHAIQNRSKKKWKLVSRLHNFWSLYCRITSGFFQYCYVLAAYCPLHGFRFDLREKKIRTFLVARFNFKLSCFTNPPFKNPCFTNPPFTNPCFTNPPFTNPCFTNPPFTNRPFTNPPFTNPCFTNPPFTNPCFTNPPFTNPPFTNPCFTNPPFTNPLHVLQIHSTPLHSMFYNMPQYCSWARTHDGGDDNDDDGVTQHGGHALGHALSVCSRCVPPFLCRIFKEKKTNDSGGWSNVLHWSNKRKKNHGKQELTAEEVAKESRGPALGKEAKQYWIMPWIIVSQVPGKKRLWNKMEHCHEAKLTKALERRRNTRQIDSEDYRLSQV